MRGKRSSPLIRCLGGACLSSFRWSSFPSQEFGGSSQSLLLELRGALVSFLPSSGRGRGHIQELSYSLGQVRKEVSSCRLRGKQSPYLSREIGGACLLFWDAARVFFPLEAARRTRLLHIVKV